MPASFPLRPRNPRKGRHGETDCHGLRPRNDMVIATRLKPTNPDNHAGCFAGWRAKPLVSEIETGGFHCLYMYPSEDNRHREGDGYSFIVSPIFFILFLPIFLPFIFWGTTLVAVAFFSFFLPDGFACTPSCT